MALLPFSPLGCQIVTFFLVRASSWERVRPVIFGSTLTTKVENVRRLHSANLRELLQVQKGWEPSLTRADDNLFWCFLLELKWSDCLGYKLSLNKFSVKSCLVSCVPRVFTPQWLHLCHALLSCSLAASGRYFRGSCGPVSHTWRLCLWNVVSCWHCSVSRKIWVWGKNCCFLHTRLWWGRTPLSQTNSALKMTEHKAFESFCTKINNDIMLQKKHFCSYHMRL